MTTKVQRWFRSAHAVAIMYLPFSSASPARAEKSNSGIHAIVMRPQFASISAPTLNPRIYQRPRTASQIPPTIPEATFKMPIGNKIKAINEEI